MDARMCDKGEMWFVNNKHTTVGVVVVVAFTVEGSKWDIEG